MVLNPTFVNQYIPKPDKIQTDITTCKTKKLKNKNPCNQRETSLSVARLQPQEHLVVRLKLESETFRSGANGSDGGTSHGLG